MSTRGRGGAGLELAAGGAEVPCSRSAVVLVVPLETTIAYGATNGAAEWNKGTQPHQHAASEHTPGQIMHDMSMPSVQHERYDHTTYT